MGRPPKTEKGKMEERLRLAWYMLNKGNQYLADEHIKVLAAFAIALQYFEEKDEDESTNHAECFKRIYLEKDSWFIDSIRSTKVLEMLGVEIVIDSRGKRIQSVWDDSEFAKDITKANIKIMAKDITPKRTKEAKGRLVGKSRRSITRHTSIYIRKVEKVFERLKM